MAKKDVAVAEEKTNLPAEFMDDLASMAGEGHAQDISDYAMPFLKVLQSLSPELDPRDAAYIKGAQPGEILNTVTGEIYGSEDGVFVIPVFYQRKFIRWNDRKSGGGMVAQYSVEEGEKLLAQTTKNDKKQDVFPDGTYLSNTAEHYVLLYNPVSKATEGRALITMTSTQLKKSRKWNSIMGSIKMPKPGGGTFTPPSFSHVYKLTTVGESNAQGRWSGWAIENVGAVPTRDLLMEGKEFYDLIAAGNVKVNYSADQEATEAPAAASDDVI